MRILIALPGIHLVPRGAEVAFESVAQEMALHGEHEVTLVGSGPELPGRAYRYARCAAVPREHFERFPSIPFLRHEYAYEELTFAAGLVARRGLLDVDVTLTCSYPYVNWALRSRLPGMRRPAHVFVTHNGDWAAQERRAEYRFFSCDGLICINSLFLARNRERWNCALIPNGFDAARFHPGPPTREALGLPVNRPVVLMVSALIADKRVLEGIRAVARIPEAFLVVAGDGPLREEADRLAAELLPGRFLRRTFAYPEMPAVYRSADVVLHMSQNESFGILFTEALGTGKPVVAHDGPVSRWILEDKAQLIDTTSEPEVVRALESALADRGAGAEDRAAFAAAKYTWKAIAAHYLEFLGEVVERRERTARHGSTS